MSFRFAIDTNIAVYTFTDTPQRDMARELLERGPMISVQLLNEFTNIASRKLARSWTNMSTALLDIRRLAVNIRPVDLDVHELGLALLGRHQISVYDSLMLAAAVLMDCDSFYSENMQHGLVIEDRLTIINPLLQLVAA